MGCNVDRKASDAASIPDTLHACSWRLDILWWIRPRGWVYRYVLRHAWLNLWDKHITTGSINQVADHSNRELLVIRSGDWTNTPKSSGNHIARGQSVAMRISSHWSRWVFSSTRGNSDGGGYAYGHDAFQLTDRASTPTADGSGTWHTNSGSCDSTLL